MSVFLKGCPLQCVWCHNPESQSPEPEIFLVRERCLGCGECVAVCQNGRDQEPERVVASRCTACGLCVRACASGARKLMGERLAVPDLLAKLERERPFFEQSGGGVTFTGGEPLMQPEFLIACLEACRQRSIHTAVDTSGFSDEHVISDVAGIADLFLFDLKIMDDALHRQATGKPVAPILRNAEAIDRSGVEIWIRLPLVPGINDSDANIEALGRFVSSLKNTRKLFILPYHRLGSHKPKHRRQQNPTDWLEPPTSEAVDRVAEKLRGFGLDVHKP